MAIKQFHGNWPACPAREIRMKILIVSQYFPPEAGAAVQRVGSFARYLTEFGHDVTVICQTPNYPTGRVFRGFKNKLRQIKEESGYRVVRTITYPTKNTSLIKRLVNYTVFSISAFSAAVFEPKPNVILVSSPPLFAAGSALLLSLIKRVPLVVDVRDVWPGVAMGSGFVNRLIFSPMRLLEKLLYWRATAVTTVSEGVVDVLSEENRSEVDKFKVVYNGLDPQLVGASGGLGRSGGRNKSFTVIYSGTVGTQQPWEALLEVANILEKEKEIRFIICGEGVEREDLEKKLRARNLTNVKFLGLLSYRDSLAKIRESDLGLVLLVRNKYVDPALPVKIFDYCFVGIPVLASASLFLKNFIEKNRIGFWVKPGNPQELAKKILDISRLSRVELKRIGGYGKSLVENTYNRRIQARKLEEILKNVRS